MNKDFFLFEFGLLVSLTAWANYMWLHLQIDTLVQISGDTILSCPVLEQVLTGTCATLSNKWRVNTVSGLSAGKPIVTRNLLLASHALEVGLHHE